MAHAPPSSVSIRRRAAHGFAPRVLRTGVSAGPHTVERPSLGHWPPGAWTSCRRRWIRHGPRPPPIDFVEADVTQLRASGTGADFAMVVDSGCLHGLRDQDRDGCASEVTAVSAPRAVADHRVPSRRVVRGPRHRSGRERTALRAPVGIGFCRRRAGRRATGTALPFAAPTMTTETKVKVASCC